MISAVDPAVDSASEEHEGTPDEVPAAAPLTASIESAPAIATAPDEVAVSGRAETETRDQSSLASVEPEETDVADETTDEPSAEPAIEESPPTPAATAKITKRNLPADERASRQAIVAALVKPNTSGASRRLAPDVEHLVAQAHSLQRGSQPRLSGARLPMRTEGPRHN